MKKIIAILLAVFTLTALVSCANGDDGIPDGMKIATVSGCDFRLFIPTTWNSNTAYGVSGGYYSLSKPSSVSVCRYESDAADEQAFFDTEIKPDLSGIYGEFEIKTSYSVLGDVNALQLDFEVVNGEMTLEYTYLIGKKNGAFYVFTEVMEKEIRATLSANVEDILDNFIFAEPYASPDYAKKIKKAPALNGMKVACDEKAKFVLYVPEDWVVDPENEIAAAFDESDRTSVIATPWVPTQSMDAKEYYELVTGQLQAQFGENFTLLSDLDQLTETTLGGSKGYVIDYTVTFGEETYRYREISAVHDGTVYVLTFTAKNALWGEHTDDFEMMKDAFVFD